MSLQTLVYWLSAKDDATAAAAAAIVVVVVVVVVVGQQQQGNIVSTDSSQTQQSYPLQHPYYRSCRLSMIALSALLEDVFEDAESWSAAKAGGVIQR